MFPGLTHAQQDRIAQQILEFVGGESGARTSDAAPAANVTSQRGQGA